MFKEDIKKLAKENLYFRRVLYTGSHSQVVVMNIPTGSDIGEEVHPEVDQIVVIVDGEAEARLEGETQVIEEHDLVFVPAGTVHNFRNIGDEDLKLYTIYAPPEHPEGTIHKTKAEALSGKEGG